MLSDCVSTDSSACELFIAQEGAVALTAKQMRDRLTQAVLPISSAMMAIRDAEIYDVLDDEQVKAIIACLGVGVCLDGDEAFFSPGSLRYNKLILVTEATAEGRYIREQVVTYLYRFSYPVIAGGYAYLVRPDNWAGMGENEFESKVISPDTRRIVQFWPRHNIEETLVLLRERI